MSVVHQHRLCYADENIKHARVLCNPSTTAATSIICETVLAVDAMARPVLAVDQARKPYFMPYSPYCLFGLRARSYWGGHQQARCWDLPTMQIMTSVCESLHARQQKACHEEQRPSHFSLLHCCTSCACHSVSSEGGRKLTLLHSSSDALVLSR
jgi:hypothetical protein